MNDVACVVLVTCASAEEGEKIAETLVTERLVACVNVLNGVKSFYRWEGALQKGEEVLLVMKTHRSSIEKLEARVKALHSYTVPEFVVLSVSGGSQDYLNWIAENVC